MKPTACNGCDAASLPTKVEVHIPSKGAIGRTIAWNLGSWISQVTECGAITKVRWPHKLHDRHIAERQIIIAVFEVTSIVGAVAIRGGAVNLGSGSPKIVGRRSNRSAWPAFPSEIRNRAAARVEEIAAFESARMGIMRSLGLPKGVSLHTLRHTHASHLLSMGVSLPAISKRLGHANTNVTAQVYAHALERDEFEAADAWERSMGKLNGGEGKRQ
jgi:hypothetical protein